MHQLPVLILAVVAGTASLSGQQQAEAPVQGPTFRTGVDVIAVDVAVVDAKGAPVENLLPPDFQVKIAGQPRRVVSAELIKIDVDAARQAPAATHHLLEDRRYIHGVVDRLADAHV